MSSYEVCRSGIIKHYEYESKQTTLADCGRVFPRHVMPAGLMSMLFGAKVPVSGAVDELFELDWFDVLDA